ncbi:hypothetical protein NLU13_5154 [Sarocladium strictum]|uniref:tRNA(Ile)-lysidine synthetase n=1 Tax=Sarocladium strictum TaxID=5046 RepID=A0AA39GGP7_SARSR|nr:hypothetical protein NLU13_5154 [Sarocladium strictum]
MGTPPAYNQATSPVSPNDFKDALDAVCKPRWRMARWARPRPIALAVSGGLDSMAMAFLFSVVSKTYFPNLKVADNPVSTIHGMVIDHGLREGSDREARQVVAWLHQIGIRARSMALGQKARGGRSVDLQNMPSFETAARSLRYRTLGLSALDLGVSSLFSAHHRDDQYETLLMRLLAGHRYRGLQGIRPANPIPESYDLHSVYSSGLLDDQQQPYPFLSFKPTNRTIRRIRSMFQEDRTEELLDRPDLAEQKSTDWFPGHFTRTIDPHVPYLTPLPCEDGGITVYRPLLAFDKDRLRATCEANKVPWVEDHTNSDPTLTTRNAVRYMVRHHELPRALQKPAIIALGERVKRRVNFEEAEATRLLIREAVIKDFDTNVGTLLVELPTLGGGKYRGGKLFRRAREQAWLPHRRRIAGLVTRKLMDFVSPEHHLPSLSNLDIAINGLFPELDPESRHSDPKAFSIGGVLFDPVVAKGTTRWLLSRAPYSSREARPHMRSQECPRRRCGPHGSLVEPVPSPTPWRIWKHYQLYDGRFWLRLSFRVTSPPFIIRPYEPESGKAFRRALPAKQRARLERLLKCYAPGKVRTTLPAVYGVGETTFDGEHASETPTLLALPTLRVHLPGMERHITYEARYRNVDVSLLGHRKKGDGKPSRLPLHQGTQGL